MCVVEGEGPIPTRRPHTHIHTHTQTITIIIITTPHTNTQVAYHDFEGVTVRMGERERLVANLGAPFFLFLLFFTFAFHFFFHFMGGVVLVTDSDAWAQAPLIVQTHCTNRTHPIPSHFIPNHHQTQKGDKNVMILRNHGLLVCGSTVANAFFSYYSLQRACEVKYTYIYFLFVWSGRWLGLAYVKTMPRHSLSLFLFYTPPYPPSTTQNKTTNHTQIQVTTESMSGPNIPIPERIAQDALAGAMAADPTGAFEWCVGGGAC